MAIAAEYEAIIQTLEWSDLRSLWEGIENRDTPDWDPGKAFEYLVLIPNENEDDPILDS